MVIKHDVILTDDRFRYLTASAEAFEAIKKDEKFIHVRVYYAMGPITEVTSNDERLAEIKNSYEKEIKMLSEMLRISKEENTYLKSRGFFKRLFS